MSGVIGFGIEILYGEIIEKITKSPSRILVTDLAVSGNHRQNRRKQRPLDTCIAPRRSQLSPPVLSEDQDHALPEFLAHEFQA